MKAPACTCGGRILATTRDGDRRCEACLRYYPSRDVVIGLRFYYWARTGRVIALEQRYMSDGGQA